MRKLLPGVGAGGFPCASAAVVIKLPIATADRIALETNVARVFPEFIFMDLQSCSCVEVNNLGSIVFRCDQRNAEADLDRPEGRFPGDTYTSGGPESEVVANTAVGL